MYLECEYLGPQPFKDNKISWGKSKSFENGGTPLERKYSKLL